MVPSLMHGSKEGSLFVSEETSNTILNFLVSLSVCKMGWLGK